MTEPRKPQWFAFTIRKSWRRKFWLLGCSLCGSAVANDDAETHANHHYDNEDTPSYNSRHPNGGGVWIQVIPTEGGGTVTERR